MKLQDYKNPQTGEIKEIDLHEFGHMGVIPETLELEGVVWERVWGQVAVNMPLHMTAKHNSIHRFRNRGISSSITGKKTYY